MNAAPGTRPPVVVILAAGEGTRMRSRLPKVLHAVSGRTLLEHVLTAAAAIEPHHVMVVVGHGRDEVIAHLDEVAPWVDTVVQSEQRGTGHAVRVALTALVEGGHLDAASTGPVIVLSGDTPLLTGDTVRHLVDAHSRHRAAITLLSAVLEDPTGYGRIVRDTDDHVQSIIEHRDADETVLAISEINAGMYVFEFATLAEGLRRLGSDNAQGEEYLTDVLGIAHGDGEIIVADIVADPVEILGVNDRAQLAEAAAHMRDRINAGWLAQGVSMLDPFSVWIDVDVDLAPDVMLLPQTFLHGPTSIASGARIGPGVTLTSCEVGEEAQIRHAVADLAVIGPRATVGPYTYLRPGTRLGEGAKAGSYVEIKNAEVGDGAKVPHLSYVGDAQIGEGTNIGAATVFVNYDGATKHHTVVGRHVRIGSDTMLVAPVTIGDGAYTAAGSVITEDVPPGSMAVGRARQRNIDGWVTRRRAESPSAQAAEAAQRQEESS